MTIAAKSHVHDAAGAWDAVVVGAGPAGASAALLLARRGLRTLLVERKAFPREKVCGGCLNGRSLAALDALGLGTLCDRLDAGRIDRLRLRNRVRVVELPLPEGRALSRSALDAALVSAAIDAGAAFIGETHAIVLPEPPGMVADNTRRLLLTARGKETETTASIVLAADGLGQPSLDRLPEFAPRVSYSARVGLGAVIDGSDAKVPSGQIAMSIGRAGYVGAVRVEGGRLNVAAAVDSELLRRNGPAGAIAAMLDDAGSPRLPDGIRWRGTLPLTRRSPRVAGRRLFLLGDAAGYIEPFTGEGMAWAFTGAIAVAPLAERACFAWNAGLAAAWERTYAIEIRRRQRVCRLVAGLLRRPAATTLAMSVVTAFPTVARPLIHSLAPRPYRPGVAT